MHAGCNNPEDIVTGSIENIQSLNRFAYCQGNPINYLDPFGLEPCEFFTGLGHGMLNLLGLIRGIGDVFDITNAIWYALEGNWGRCFEAGIAAIPFIGNFLPDRRTCDYVRRALNIVSYGGTGFLAGQGVVDGGKALWAEINSGQCSGWNIFLGVASVGLNGATLFFSGKGFVQETGNLNKMLKADVGKSNDWINNRETELFLPDEYYINLNKKIQNGYQNPNTKEVYRRLGNTSHEIETSIVISDEFGRIKYRIDYSTHGNDIAHTNPHIHEYVPNVKKSNDYASQVTYFLDYNTGRMRKGISNNDNTYNWLD